MKNDYKVFFEGENIYSGFSNPINFKKSRWNEERYGKVFALTQGEEKLLDEVFTAEVNRILAE